MTLPRSVAAVVFDMDGLLVDTESIMLRALRGAAEDMGFDLPFAVFQQMVGLTHLASDQIMRDHFGPSMVIADYLAAVKVRAAQEREVGVRLKAGVLELLDHLDEVGMPRAVATSSSLEAVGLHLGPSGLVPRFHAVITRESVTRGKPHPEPYLKAAAALGVAPESCLALEDSHNGVRAAAAAGMMTIMVPDMLEATEEMRGLCLRIAYDLHEVHDLLRL